MVRWYPPSLSYHQPDFSIWPVVLGNGPATQNPSVVRRRLGASSDPAILSPESTQTK